MKESLRRYFIAILPTGDIASEARTIQLELAENYRTKGALRSPPHITLHMPFNWKERKESDLIDSLSGFFASIKPFVIYINGFGSFQPRVIFMKIQNSDELS